MARMRLAGIDLAWKAGNRSAVAVGRWYPDRVVLEEVHECFSVDELIEVASDADGIAVDGSLIVTNERGQRPCEGALSSHYGARGVGCHSSNLARSADWTGRSFAAALERRGFRHLGEPEAGPFLIECYPHPALIEIFGLPRRLAYKKGTVDAKRAGQIELATLLGSLEHRSGVALAIPDGMRDYFDATRIASLRGGGLKRNEDVLDAIVCLFVCALYAARSPCRIFGDVRSGYVVVPRSTV